MDEAALAGQAATGNAAAFAALVRAHEGAVRRFAARLAGGDGDDIAQDAFVTAWRKAASYRGAGSYRGWLLRIAYHAFLDTRRGDTRRAARQQAAMADGTPDDPDLNLDLARALAALPARERAAALLCFAEGCSHGEAATIMALPLGTLKSVLARARHALAADLGMAYG